MKYEQWLMPEATAAAASRLMQGGYPYLISAVMSSRGVREPKEVARRLHTEPTLTLDPFLMKDMDKAVLRIQEAIRTGEKIAVFGDYDVDGITATCVLTDYLRSLSAQVVYHIPHRTEEGYGLGREAIAELAQEGVTLLVTVDCGITGVEETVFAQSIGVDVVVTDHHECKDSLPDAFAVVNPHRPDCPYPFKHLAGVGVALKLVLALGGEARREELLSRYCTLAAIGTVADMMRMEDENRVIVRRGLSLIRNTPFVGLSALLREAELWEKSISSIQIGFVLAPRINAAGRMGNAELAAQLFFTTDEEEAAEYAQQLCLLNRERQVVEQEIYADALERLALLPENLRHAIVLSSEDWRQGVVGIVASRLVEQFSSPSFMICLHDGMGKGSCRSANGMNLFAALESCADLLEGFGGHEMAAGFTIREENVPAFRERMNRYALEKIGVEKPPVSLTVDTVLERAEWVTITELEELRRLEPYGLGNERPVFCFCGALVKMMQNVGQNRHLKLCLQKGKYSFDAIFFSATVETCGVAENTYVDAAFYLQINEFRGNRTVQLQIIDLRPATLSPDEQEQTELVERLNRGEILSPQEAARLLPARDQFVHLWHILEKRCGGAPLRIERQSLLRMIADELTGADHMARAMLCLLVFSERGLLSIRKDGAFDIVCPNVNAKHVSLEDSPYLRKLQKMRKFKKRDG